MKTLLKKSLASKIALFSFFISISLNSCDYESQAMIFNQTDDKIQLITDDQIDGFYKHAQLISQHSGFYLYELDSGLDERLFFNFNTQVNPACILFDTLIVYSKQDTLKLYGKSTIFSAFKRESKFLYSLDINK